MSGRGQGRGEERPGLARAGQSPRQSANGPLLFLQSRIALFCILRLTCGRQQARRLAPIAALLLRLLQGDMDAIGMRARQCTTVPRRIAAGHTTYRAVCMAGGAALPTQNTPMASLRNVEARSEHASGEGWSGSSMHGPLPLPGSQPGPVSPATHGTGCPACPLQQTQADPVIRHLKHSFHPCQQDSTDIDSVQLYSGGCN